MSKVTEPGTLAAAYATAAEHDALVLAEKFIDGAEFTVGILGDSALPLIRLQRPRRKPFTTSKPNTCATTTQYHCPAGCPMHRNGAAATRAGCLPPGGRRGWGRVDMMLDSLGNPICWK